MCVCVCVSAPGGYIGIEKMCVCVCVCVCVSAPGGYIGIEKMCVCVCVSAPGGYLGYILEPVRGISFTNVTVRE